MQSSSHTKNFLANPLVVLATAFMFGILSTEIIPTKLRVVACLAAFASLLSLACLILRRFFAASMVILLAYLLAGTVFASLDSRRDPDSLAALIDNGIVPSGEPVELIGVLQQQPEAAPESFYLTLRVEHLNLKGNQRTASGTVSLLLAVGQTAEADYRELNLHYGARIRTITALKRAETFRNPGGVSFVQYLDRKGFAAVAFVKSPRLIERLDDEPVFLPLAWLYQWRQQLQQRINSHFKPETAGVLNASLLGNRYFLSRDASESLRDGGTFHVLVISGLHISFIGGLVLLLAKRVTKRRLTQFLLSAIVLWSYAIAVGAEASVVRAAFMFTLLAFAPVIARRATSLNGLAAAALALLAWRPGDLFDPSFQLTFLSVAAIVVFAWPLLQLMSHIGLWRPTRASPYPPNCTHSLRAFSEALFWQEKKWRRESQQLNYSYKLFKNPIALRLERYHLQSACRYAFAALLISVSVQVTLLPLFVVYFHRLSISGLVLNIGVSILMAVLLFAGLAALLVAPLNSVVATPLINLTNFLEWLMVHGVDPFVRLGVASIRLPEYSGTCAAVYAVFFVPLAVLAMGLVNWNPLTRTMLTSRWRNVVKVAAVSQLLLIAVILVHPFSELSPEQNLRVDFLDVGQADAALVTLPDGTTLLVDGGGRPNFFQKKGTADGENTFERDTRSIGEAVVSEYLWWRGLDRVDYLLATHAHADHMSGLNDIAKNFKVRAALVARTPTKDEDYAEFSATLERKGIPLKLIAAGDELVFGNVNARVLWPLASLAQQSKSGNNESVVLRLEFKDRAMLLLGDIESQSETMLLAQSKLAGDSMLRASLVKVAHHGSRTSSIESFVKTVRPEFAVISVGKNSMFGHPHREVVERWRAVGADVLTTGEKGTITVITDGRDLKVGAFAHE